MRIQFISLSAGASAFAGAGLELASFSNPRPFDAYDWNVIDTNSRYVWESKQKTYHRIALEDELALLGRLSQKTTANVLFLLPGNVLFSYHYLPHTAYRFQKSIHLGEIPAVVSAILAPLVGNDLTLEVRPKEGISILQKTYSSFFTLHSHATTLSPESDGLRLVRLDSHRYGTSLLCTNYDELVNLLHFLEDAKDKHPAPKTSTPQKEPETLPSWLDEIAFEEDHTLLKEIHLLEAKLAQKKAALEARREEKAILAAYGTKLSQHVVDVLKEATETPLEAMRYLDLDGGRFIFDWGDRHLFVLCRANEKALHMNDLIALEKRLSAYQEKTGHAAKGLLVTNHQYHLPPEERTPLDIAILQEAEKKNLLVCTTMDLLRALQGRTSGLYTTEALKTIFLEESGLLQY